MHAAPQKLARSVIFHMRCCANPRCARTANTAFSPDSQPPSMKPCAANEQCSPAKCRPPADVPITPSSARLKAGVATQHPRVRRPMHARLGSLPRALARPGNTGSRCSHCRSRLLLGTALPQRDAVRTTREIGQYPGGTGLFAAGLPTGLIGQITHRRAIGVMLAPCAVFKPDHQFRIAAIGQGRRWRAVCWRARPPPAAPCAAR